MKFYFSSTDEQVFESEITYCFLSVEDVLESKEVQKFD